MAGEDEKVVLFYRIAVSQTRYDIVNQISIEERHRLQLKLQACLDQELADLGFEPDFGADDD